ncbi:MAG: pseudaminic acid cytidylyltransferase [Lachnospiraceae bacterium]|jgi:N-acylneuraminate cytidylyltransferase|nr:pseudaminic acid cytidylyltransferase [Lachnospiraceae bacterium]
MELKKGAVAIITARGGSKRIPRKNIKLFCGQPIIAYPIRAAIESGCFDTVMVSTEDEEIAAIAREYGAEIPFMRSMATAGDMVTTDDVLREVLMEYRQRGEEYEQFCCIYPTSPLLDAKRLQTAMKMLAKRECDGVIPIVAFPSPPQRGIVIKAGMACRQYPVYQDARSQDLETIYRDSGQFYACRTDAFFAAGTLMVEKLHPLILSEMETQDIDTDEDWWLAELKWRNR